jgi:hypothetical protein
MRTLKAFWQRVEQEQVPFSQAVAGDMARPLSSGAWEELITSCEAIPLRHRALVLGGAEVNSTASIDLDAQAPTLRMFSELYCGARTSSAGPSHRKAPQVEGLSPEMSRGIEIVARLVMSPTSKSTSGTPQTPSGSIYRAALDLIDRMRQARRALVEEVGTAKAARSRRQGLPVTRGPAARRR